MARVGPERHRENKFSKIKYSAVCLIESAQKGQTTATVTYHPLYKSMFVTTYSFQTYDTTGYSESGGIPPNMSKTLFQRARGLSSVTIKRCKIRGGIRLIGSRQTPLDTVRNEDTLQMLHDWQLLNCNIL